MTKYQKCIRCGVCCSSGICSSGIEDENGLCKYLQLENNNITSCQLIIDNKMPRKSVGIGNGCILRVLPDVYDYYLEEMKLKIENMRDKHA